MELRGEGVGALIPAPSAVVDVPRIPLVARNSKSGLRLAPMLRRHRLAIGVTFILCMLAAALLSGLQTPLFRARTVLEIQGYNREFLNRKDLDPMSSPGDSSLSTQTRLIRTDTLAERVATRTSLMNEPGFFRRSSLMTALQRFLRLSEPVLPVRKNDTVQELLGRIGVKPDGDSDLINVTVDTPDARLSASLANELTAEYIEQEREERSNNAGRVSSSLTGQLRQLRLNLQTSEDRLQAYAKTAGLLFTDEHNNVADEKLRQIQQDFSHAQTDRAEKQAQMEMIASSPADSLPRVLDDGPTRDLANRLAELRRQYAELNATLTPTHYKVQRVRDQILEVEDQLAHQRSTVVARIRIEYIAAVRREQLLQEAYAKEAGLVSNQNSLAVRYNVLRREVDTNRELYSSMLQKVNEASVLSAVRTNSVRVVDPAKTPEGRYRPDYRLNFGLGLMAAMICSALVAVVRERADRSIREPGEVSLLHLRELGAVPSARSDPRVRGLFQPDAARRLNETYRDPAMLSKGVDQHLVTFTRSGSVVAEAFRSIAISLMNHQAGQVAPPKVIAITSPHQNAGKSTAAANLAVAMADGRRRLLLIDGDLRRPRLHALFGLSPTPGLAEVLARQTPITASDLAELARYTPIPGLRIVTAGTGVNPAILGSDRFGTLIAKLRAEYDIILIDTSPLLLLPDARLISKQADGVVLVCRAGHTGFDQVSGSSRLLEDDGSTLLGAILNDWDPKIANPKYFRSYYSSYGSDRRHERV